MFSASFSRLPPGAKATGAGSASSLTAARRTSRSTPADIQADLDRRRPGQSDMTTHAQGGRRRQHHLRRLRRPHARHAHCPAGRQHRRPPRGVCGDARKIPPLARRLHLSGQIRPAQPRRRRALLRARNHWTRRRRGHREKNPRARRRRGNPRLRRAGAQHRPARRRAADRRRSPALPHPRGSRGQRRALPGRQDRGKDDQAHQVDARERRLRRRRHRLPRARPARGPRRAGVRPARGRPGQGHALAARDERL